MTLVDTTVLLDLATDDPAWTDRSVRHLDVAAFKGGLPINDVIYAERSVRFARVEALEAVVAGAGLVRRATPRETPFLAARKAVRRWAPRGGKGVLKPGGSRAAPLRTAKARAHRCAIRTPPGARDPR